MRPGGIPYVLLVASVVTGVASVVTSGQTPEAGEASFVDGAMFVRPPRRAVLRQNTVQLAAPDLPARQVELAPTVIPADRLDEIRRRASDLNGDGVVDDVDRAMLRQGFGPCPAGERCPNDLNADGRVDDADEKLLMEHLGRTCNMGVPQFEEVGYIQPAPANLLEPLPQRARADGSRAVRVELRSANAVGLRLQFKGFQPSGGLELRVYDPAGTTVLGPYSTPRLGEDGTWWGPTVFGDTIGLELRVPADMAAPTPLPTISSVMYMYCTDPVACHDGFPPGATMNCHNDVTCSPSWADNEAQAVALMYFLTAGACGRCTGALLNRGPGDSSPLFMTANHCVSTQAQADTLEIFWLYNTPGCGDPPPNLNDVDRTDGGLVLKRHTGTDWSLLGLFEPPAVGFYLGWDAGTWASGGGATGIHHPRGTFKRISTGSTSGSSDGANFCDPSGTVMCSGCAGGVTTCIAVDTWNVAYTSGTTEPGSSGSPIFDASSRMRGTLTGGPSGCAPVTAQYGRLDRAFTNLRYYLDNADVPASAVFVNGAVPGDMGNNGNTERGTILNPFNSVHEATFCVRSGQEVRVAPGTYSERMTLWRPMRITRNGASGTVRIGG